MLQTKEQLYELIKDLKTKEAFEQEIQKRYQEHDELLDEDTIALLLVDELGRYAQGITKIVDLKPDVDATIIAKVTHIHPLKTFTRKNGSAGKVLNLEITDGSGACGLVLWNDDVERARELKPGMTVKIINGYTKNGFSGLEVNLGRWGLLEINPEDAPSIIQVKTTQAQPTEKHAEITGILTRKEPTHAFFRDDGEIGFVTTITLKAESGEQRLTVWAEKVKEIQQYKVGDQLTIEGITRKQTNGSIELHLNGNSTIQRR